MTEPSHSQAFREYQGKYLTSPITHTHSYHTRVQNPSLTCTEPDITLADQKKKQNLNKRAAGQNFAHPPK